MDVLQLFQHPLYCLCAFVKDHLTVFAQACLLALHSVPLISSFNTVMLSFLLTLSLSGSDGAPNCAVFKIVLLSVLNFVFPHTF